MQWTVVAIAIGGGADGEGVSPSPVSREEPHISGPTPAPRFALLPLPAGGGSHGDKRWFGEPELEHRRTTFLQDATVRQNRSWRNRKGFGNGV